MRFLLSVLILIFGFSFNLNAQSNIKKLNTIKNKIESLSYNDGIIFVFALNYNSLGNIEEYYTGQLKFISKKESAGYVTSSKGYQCKERKSKERLQRIAQMEVNSKENGHKLDNLDQETQKTQMDQKLNFLLHKAKHIWAMN